MVVQGNMFELDLRECQIRCHREAIERRFLNWIGPVRLIGLETRGGLAIELHQVERLVVDSGIVIVHGLLEFLRIQPHRLCKLFDGVCLLRWLVSGLVYPAALELLHYFVIGHEEARHVLIFPAVEGNHLEGRKEVPLAFVVEPFAVVVDNDSVVVACSIVSFASMDGKRHVPFGRDLTTYPR